MITASGEVVCSYPGCGVIEPCPAGYNPRSSWWCPDCVERSATKFRAMQSPERRAEAKARLNGVYLEMREATPRVRRLQAMQVVNRGR